jgi:glycosyltransferase involved in cell wall biosynthesis
VSVYTIGSVIVVETIKRLRIRFQILNFTLYLTCFRIGKKVAKYLPISTSNKFKLASLAEQIFLQNQPYFVNKKSKEMQIKTSISKNKIKFLIDGQCLTKDTFYRGIGRYSLQLTKHLALRNSNIEFIVFTTNLGTNHNVTKLKKELSGWKIPNLKLVVFEIKPQQKIVILEEAKSELQKKLEEIGASYILITSAFEHPLDRIPIYTIKNAKTAVLIHDLIPLHYQNELLPTKISRNRYLSQLQNCLKTDQIFTNSEFTRRDFMKITNRRNGIQTVGGAGFSENRKKIQINDKQRNGIFCVGAETSHKNIEGLIISYSGIPKEIQNLHPLRILGIKDQIKQKKFMNLTNVSSKNVFFLNNLTENELSNFYSKSKVVVVPSFIEGLSMPIFEAWNHQTPVIAGDGTVMEEIIKDPEMIFNLSKSSSQTELIQKLLTNQKFWDEKQAKLNESRKKYSWDLVAASLDAWIELT